MEEPPRQPAGRNNTAHLKSFFTCHRCNTRPMPGVAPMMGHIHAKRHRNMLASLDEQERQEQLELDRRFFAIAKQIQQPRTKQGAYKRKTSPHEDSNHNKGHQLKRARLSSSSSWRCEMCAIAFTGRAPFVQHVLGKKHKTAVGEWLSQGKTVPEHCLPARYLSPPLGSLSPSSSASTSPSASRSSSFGEQEGKNAEGVEEGEELPPLLKVKAEPIDGGNSAISEALSTSEATRAIKQEEEECQPTVQASVPSPWPVQPPSTITNKPLGADVQNEQPNNTEQLDPGSENQYVHEHKSNQTSSLLLEIPSAPTSSASSSAATTSSSSSCSSSCSSSASASPTASASSAPSSSSAATAASSPSPTNPAFFCKICQVGCNTALDFLIHENGKRHSKAFMVNKLQSWTEGQKEQLPEEETLYCKVCKKQFLQLEVLNDHRQGKKHQSKLSMAKQKALMQLPPSHFIRRRLVADSSQMQTLFKELPLDYLRSLVDEYEQQQQHNATPNQPAPASHPSIPFSLAQTQFASLFSATPPIPLPSNGMPLPSSSSSSSSSSPSTNHTSLLQQQYQQRAQQQAQAFLSPQLPLPQFPPSASHPVAPNAHVHPSSATTPTTTMLVSLIEQIRRQQVELAHQIQQLQQQQRQLSSISSAPPSASTSASGSAHTTAFLNSLLAQIQQQRPPAQQK